MHKIIDYINRSCDIGDEYQRIFGRQMPTGKFTCPNPAHIHNNHTPSCKRYGNVFKCFGQCNRVFGVYDLLKWYSPQRINELKSQVIIEDVKQVHKSNSLAKISYTGSDMVEVLEQITGICLRQ